MLKKIPDIGPLEMKVLGIVASGQGLSVASIRKSLKGKRQDLAYTTVMTVLIRLYNKGLIKRKKEGRQYLYSMERKKDFSPIKILERVKKSLFGSNRLQPILGLLDSDENLSISDLEELRRTINERIKKKGKQ